MIYVYIENQKDEVAAAEKYSIQYEEMEVNFLSYAE